MSPIIGNACHVSENTKKAIHPFLNLNLTIMGSNILFSIAANFQGTI